MATFVLVHGAWSGGWCYGRVADMLRAEGHRVFTPTLTGQGERSHLLTGAVNLSTHIADVAGVFANEGLDGAVLAGHSYGGMVITGVADRMPEKIAALVYLDAFLPEDGQSLFDLNVPANTQRFIANAGDIGGLAVPPPPAAFFNVNANDAERVDRLATPFPLAAMAERLKLTGKHRSIARRIYVHGTVLPRESPFKPFYERVRNDPAWTVHALACGHHVMLDMPDKTAEILKQAV
ncbi:alpha/beta hydrolase [Pseudolabrys taiwanensis]|uniref:Alpha/beta hydrolase n=1 Tax=Pseudolabrys taiwanensis TaxID=331696 RepID=A0A346A1L4_9HYPH|nr:alpha/beta hydrolase [Pseudolabrys taiwanensis]AXK83061.1 alpha/beta hydrolase [Pseudolabrys taiwanensis]